MGKKLNSRRCLFTNADRIRSMTDEELANWMASNDRGVVTEIGRKISYEHWLDWLRQEAQDGEG